MAPYRVMFLFLGRSSALGRFTLELAQDAFQMPGIAATLSISRQNALAARIQQSGIAVHLIDTFSRPTFWTLTSNFWRARHQLLKVLQAERPSAVITLMPHVWTPLLVRAVQQLGIRYVSIVHDAVAHPGDPTGRVARWLLNEARSADLVITLSRTVADRLVSFRVAPAKRIIPLFHPDLRFGGALANRVRDPTEPLRLLFFGRIQTYKGLPVLIDAVELIRAEGIPVRLGVAGMGSIGAERSRLDALGAEVINRWIEDDEVPSLLARYEAIALPHIEASQSGVAATAFGACMPVVAMPVGGIIEQLDGGRNGILAYRADARSLADAIHRLAVDPRLYAAISRHLSATAEDRSMARFVDEIISEVLRRF